MTADANPQRFEAKPYFIKSEEELEKER